MKAGTVEVEVEELKESRPANDGASVVLDTTALIDGERHDTLIEVARADAPAVAVALMNPSSAATPGADDALAPALFCLAAGVVDGIRTEGVRVHLQFDSGEVLPVKLSFDAAEALARGLAQHLGQVRGARP